MESGGRRTSLGIAAGRAHVAAGSQVANGQREIIAGFVRLQRVFAVRTRCSMMVPKKNNPHSAESAGWGSG